ncbi:MAG: HIT family protein [Exilispira sp.]
MKGLYHFQTLFSRYVFQFDKLNYFKNKKKNSDQCILCDILKKGENSLLIYNSKLISAVVNLYPYNSGHIMLFPNRHIESYLEINDEENYHIFVLNKFFIDAIDSIYKPSGFNIGMNIGKNSGASIKHIHQHIVPRFENELGMIDIIGGSKVIVESPIVTMQKLKNFVEKNIKQLTKNLK